MSTKVQKLFSSEKELNRRFGKSIAKRTMQRMMEVRAATTLQDLSSLPPTRCHELTNCKSPTFSVDVSANKRLLFTPVTPVPYTPNNQIDCAKILSIVILEITNTHEGKVRR